MARQFYVYELADPRTGAAFYVGKGTGRRMRQHEADARAGVMSNPGKTEAIRSIHAAGLQVVARVVSEHFTEDEAIQAEAARIAALPGLTNIRAAGAPQCEPTAAETARAMIARAMADARAHPGTELAEVSRLFIDAGYAILEKCRRLECQA